MAFGHWNSFLLPVFLLCNHQTKNPRNDDAASLLEITSVDYARNQFQSYIFFFALLTFTLRFEINYQASGIFLNKQRGIEMESNIATTQRRRGGSKPKSETVRKTELIEFKVSAIEKENIQAFFEKRGLDIPSGMRALVADVLIGREKQ